MTTSNNDPAGPGSDRLGGQSTSAIRSHTDVLNEPTSHRTAEQMAADTSWEQAPMTWNHTEAIYETTTVRPLRDRIRWGAVWAGLVVAVGSYLVIQLTLVATGAIDLSDVSRGDAWWSAAAALLAFFIGGLTTGASAIWDSPTDGFLHGVVLWAVGVVALLVLSVASSGLALGALDATGAFEDVSADIEEAIDDVDAQNAGDDAQEAASWVLLGLGAAVVAAVAGGSVGAALWPRRHTQPNRRAADRYT